MRNKNLDGAVTCLIWVIIITLVIPLVCWATGLLGLIFSGIMGNM